MFDKKLLIHCYRYEVSWMYYGHVSTDFLKDLQRKKEVHVCNNYASKP